MGAGTQQEVLTPKRKFDPNRPSEAVIPQKRKFDPNRPSEPVVDPLDKQTLDQQNDPTVDSNVPFLDLLQTGSQPTISKTVQTLNEATMTPEQRLGYTESDDKILEDYRGLFRSDPLKSGVSKENALISLRSMHVDYTPDSVTGLRMATDKEFRQFEIDKAISEIETTPDQLRALDARKARIEAVDNKRIQIGIAQSEMRRNVKSNSISQDDIILMNASDAEKILKGTSIMHQEEALFDLQRRSLDQQVSKTTSLEQDIRGLVKNGANSALDVTSKAFSNQIKTQVLNQRLGYGLDQLSSDQKETFDLIAEQLEINSKLQDPELQLSDRIKLQTKAADVASKISDTKNNPRTLYDADPTSPSFGQYVDRKSANDESVEYERLVSQEAAILDGTDFQDLTRIWNNLLSKQRYITDILGEETMMTSSDPSSQITIGRKGSQVPMSKIMNDPFLNPESTKDRVKLNNYTNLFIENKVKFDAVNRALLLNEDPSSVDKHWGNIFLEHAAEGFVGPVSTEADFIDNFVVSMKESGGRLTVAQEKAAEETLAQRVAKSAGDSIAPMAEILVTSYLTAGVSGAIGSIRAMQALKATMLTKWGTRGKYLYNLMRVTKGGLEGAISFGMTTNENVTAAMGVGEGGVQGLLDVINPEKWFKKTKWGKLLEAGTRVLSGASVETVQEFTGDFVDRLNKRGGDWERAFEDTFGKTAEDFVDKLAVVGLTSLAFSGAFNAGRLGGAVTSKLRALSTDRSITPEQRKKAGEYVDFLKDKQAQKEEALIKEAEDKTGRPSEEAVAEITTPEEAQAVIETNATPEQLEQEIETLTQEAEVIEEQIQRDGESFVPAGQEATLKKQLDANTNQISIKQSQIQQAQEPTITEEVTTEPVVAEQIEPSGQETTTQAEVQQTQGETSQEQGAQVQEAQLLTDLSTVDLTQPEGKTQALDALIETDTALRAFPEETLPSGLPKEVAISGVLGMEKAINSGLGITESTQIAEAVLTESDYYKDLNPEQQTQALTQFRSDIVKGFPETRPEPVTPAVEVTQPVTTEPVAAEPVVAQEAPPAPPVKKPATPKKPKVVEQPKLTRDPPPPKKERSFIKKKAEQASLSKEIIEGVSERGKFFIPISNRITSNAANFLIQEKGLELADKQVKDVSEPFSPAVRNMIAQKLIKTYDQAALKARKEGDHTEEIAQLDNAISMAEFLSEYGTLLGQGIQAFNAWSNISPLGWVRFASKELNKNVQKKRKQAKKIAKEKSKQRLKEFDVKEDTGLDKAIDFLQDMEDRLTKIGGGTLGINIPVAAAIQAITAMKLSLKATRSIAKAIEAGVTALRKTKWYQSLNEKEQTSADRKFTSEVNKGFPSIKTEKQKIEEQIPELELTEKQKDKIINLAEKADAAQEGFQKNNALRDVLSEISNIQGIELTDVAMAVWYANVLSGPNTQLRNILANMAETAGELWTASVYNPKRFPFLLQNLYKGYGRGALEAWSTLKTGYDPFKGEKVKELDVLERINFKGGAWNPFNGLKFVRRAMVAADAFSYYGLKDMRYYELAASKSMNYDPDTMTQADFEKASNELLNSKERRKEAKAQAKTEGLKGLKFKRRVLEIMEQSRPVEWIEDTNDFAARGTFNYRPEGRLGKLTEQFGRMADTMVFGGSVFGGQGIKPIKFIIPFTRIIANVTNRYLDWTIVGYWRALKPGGGGLGNISNEADIQSGVARKFTPEQRVKELIKASTGTLAMLTLFALTDEEDGVFEATANGTNDFRKNFQLKGTGWRPYSIRIGDTWYSYKNTPLAIPMMFIGAVRDDEKYRNTKLSDPSASKRTFMTFAYITSYMTEMSFLKGFSEFMDGFSESDPNKAANYWASFGTTTAKGFITPNGFTQVSRKVQEMMDLPLKKVDAWYEQFYRDIPIARNHLNDMINVLGDPVIPNSDLFISEVEHDPIWGVIVDNNAFISSPNQRSMVITDPDTLIERLPTDDEYYNFSKIRGQFIKQGIEDNLPSLQEMTKEEVRKFIKQVQNQGTKLAKAETFGI